MSEEDILDFWFGDGSAPRAEWFRKDEAFDAQIVERFGAAIEAALRGELDAWADTPRGALALVLLLDQFTRNAFRGTARAFAGDERALRTAQSMVAAGTDLLLRPLERVFVYMPFEHAESLPLQDEALRLFRALGEKSPEAAGFEDWALKHRVVIERFGRFPHRNALLGRESTPEEQAFLREPGSSF